MKRLLLFTFAALALLQGRAQIGCGGAAARTDGPTGGTMILGSEATLRNAEIILEPGATLQMNVDARIELRKGVELHVPTSAEVILTKGELKLIL